MGPTQLSQTVPATIRTSGKASAEPDHLLQIPLGIAAPELDDQLCRQCLHNLAAIHSTLFLENVPPDPIANVPVKQSKGGICALCHVLARTGNQVANLGQQGRCRSAHGNAAGQGRFLRGGFAGLGAHAGLGLEKAACGVNLAVCFRMARKSASVIRRWPVTHS